jgi:tRNA A37 threonylcarbamoyladenosine synthetase subunit TsaC/SUA5/YrdC
VDALLDGGPVGGTASTIVDLTSERPTILRMGTVNVEEIRQIAPDVIAATPGLP